MISGLGNQKFDLSDQKSINVYNEMLEITSEARRMHFEIIAAGVQTDNKGSRQAAERPDLGYTIDGIVNFHYRSVLMSDVQELLEILKSEVIGENCDDYVLADQFEREWQAWLDKQLKSDDGTWVYFMAGGGIINSGVVLHLDLESWNIVTQQEMRDHLSHQLMMPQPIKSAPCLQLFLNSKRANHKYKFVWEDRKIVPTFEHMAEFDDLNVELVELMLAMNSTLSTEQLQKLDKTHQAD